MDKKVEKEEEVEDQSNLMPLFRRQKHGRQRRGNFVVVVVLLLLLEIFQGLQVGGS